MWLNSFYLFTQRYWVKLCCLRTLTCLKTKCLQCWDNCSKNYLWYLEGFTVTKDNSNQNITNISIWYICLFWLMNISWFTNRTVLVSQVLLLSQGRSWALKNSPLDSSRCAGPPASTSQLNLLSTSCRGGGTLVSSPVRTVPPSGRWLHRLVHCVQ